MGARVAKKVLSRTGATQRRRVLLVTASADGARSAIAELEAAGCDVSVAELIGDLDVGARGLAAHATDDRLLVCDCAGNQGCERAFFLCRASGERTVVLLAIGDDVEHEAVEVLVAALRKALPASRITLLSDRVAENERPSGGARRTSPSARRTRRLAELIGAIADRTAAWPKNASFRV